MIQSTPGRNLQNIACFLGGLVLLLALACGGGGGSSSVAVSHLSVAPASTTFSIPVPGGTSASDISSEGGYPQPYAGTLAVTITRDATITGPVALAVSGLPTNVVAQFAEASTTDTTDELTIQAGYPDPTDPTFTTQLYPSTGTYTLTITATNGSTTVTSPLTLNLVQETPDFALAFISQDGTTQLDPTVISMTGTSSATVYEAIFDANSTQYTTNDSINLGAQGLPTGLTAVIGALNTSTEVYPVTITADSSLAAGIYAFELTASIGGVTRVQPAVVAYSPAPFYIQPTSAVSVAQGQTLTFPMYLGHNDDSFFGTDANTSTPAYVGSTDLAVTSGVPTGMTVSFGSGNASSDPTGLASVPLVIEADATVAPGTYQVQFEATRIGTEGTVLAPVFTLPVTVTASGAAPATWIQAVEWGQSVVMPGLPLVAGKPALLRVQLLADRTGVDAPASITATVGGTAYTLAGPAQIPTTVAEGDLPTATQASASTYAAVLPASAITAGMQVAIKAGTLTSVVTPEVRTGLTFDTTIVPIIQQGLQPVLPTDAVMDQELLAFWPLESVTLGHRAAYTTSIAVPLPPATGSSATDYSEDGWIELVSELASLRIVDKATTNYYGFFQVDFSDWNGGSSVVGLSLIGEGVGLGLDETAMGYFENSDSGQSNPALDLDNAGSVMVHEEGHAMNLNHAPAGGAAEPQLNFPYYNQAASQGAATGSWGFDPGTMTAYDPASFYDIMSYAPNTHWVSDWDYLAAMGWVGAAQGIAATEASMRATAPDVDQWVVSGWLDAAGEVHLKPLVRVLCPRKAPRPGACHLLIRSTTGQRDIAFAATRIPDLPAGGRPFSFTVPASGEVLSVEVRTGSGKSLQRASAGGSLALRRALLASAAQDGSLVVREQAGSLHLAWDAAAHPWVSVIHEGAQRTTLALHLTGGSADLSLAGLPAGGRFLVHYSDGLNAVVRTTER